MLTSPGSGLPSRLCQVDGVAGDGSILRACIADIARWIEP